MSILKNKIWPCITVIVLCMTWVLVNGDKVIDNLKTFKQWYGTSTALEGRWDNSTEYDISPPEWLASQQEPVEVRITIKDSIVDGTISTAKQRKAIPLDFILLQGYKKPFRDIIDVEAFDFVLGKRKSFGTFKMKVDGSNRLIIETDKDYFNFFPSNAILVKKSDTAFPKTAESGKNNTGND